MQLAAKFAYLAWKPIGNIMRRVVIPVDGINVAVWQQHAVPCVLQI